jgi:hypothetical protein
MGPNRDSVNTGEVSAIMSNNKDAEIEETRQGRDHTCTTVSVLLCAHAGCSEGWVWADNEMSPTFYSTLTKHMPIFLFGEWLWCDAIDQPVYTNPSECLALIISHS